LAPSNTARAFCEPNYATTGISWFGVGVGGYTLTMYIGLGTVVFILVILLIIYLVRRA